MAPKRMRDSKRHHTLNNDSIQHRIESDNIDNQIDNTDSVGFVDNELCVEGKR